MLSSLEAKPQWWREIMMATIGRSVAISCFLGGWFLPMYFAGRLEHSNVKEYDVAATHARALGLHAYAARLMRLALVEQQHEDYFLSVVHGHWLLPAMIRLFGWGATRPVPTAQTVSSVR